MFVQRKHLGTLTVLFAFATIVQVLAAQETPAVKSNPKPSAQVDLSAIGFHEPSRMDRIAEYQPSVSLDFVDANHLLLTFNRKQLIQRQPECPPEHEDR